MRKVLLFMAAVLCMAGCAKKELSGSGEGGQTVKIRIKAEYPQGEGGTKVTFENGATKFEWAGDETATLIFGKNGASNTDFNPTISSVSPGVFEGTITVPEDFDITTDLRGIVVPGENDADFRWHSGNKQARIRMYVPTEQTQKHDEFNPAHCPFYAKLSYSDLTLDGDVYTIPSVQLLSAVDMIRFNIYGKEGEKVQSIKVVANTKIAGTVEINLEESGYGTNGPSVITITAEDTPQIGGDSDNGARIFCPLTLGGTRYINEVQVTTDKAVYTKYLEDVKFSSKSSGDAAKVLTIHPVNLNLGTFIRQDKEVQDYYYRKVLSITKRSGLPSMQVTYTCGENEMISFVAVNEDFYAQSGRKQENAPLTTSTVYQACSMSKVPLAYIACKMVEEGKLDLDRPIYKYWGTYSDDDDITDDEEDASNGMLALFADDGAKAKAKKITAKMILLHTTGLDNKTYSGIRSVDDGDSDTWEWKREPDLTTYQYSGPAIHILDLALGQIAGESLEYYSLDYIFNKVGIVNANYFWKDEYSTLAAIGHEELGNWGLGTRWSSSNAAYTLRTSTEEYTKFLKWINKGADFEGGLDSELYKAMFAKYGVNTDVEGASWQGYVWRMENHADLGLMYHHRGNNGNYKGWMCTIPSSDKTLMFMTNGITSYGFYREMAKLFLGYDVKALASIGSSLPPEETDTVGNAGSVTVTEED